MEKELYITPSTRLFQFAHETLLFDVSNSDADGDFEFAKEDYSEEGGGTTLSIRSVWDD